MNIEQNIKNKALELGFLDCGFAKARKLTEHESQLKNWLSQGYHGEMKYMENHFEKRLDPTQLVDGAKTVIVLAYNYFPKKLQNPQAPQIAKYAYGEDYHVVVKDQCFSLFNYIKELLPSAQGRCFVDSAPVMERQWAQIAGLGWLGKNSLLLKKGVGSYFFLAEIIIDQEIEASPAFLTDHCGECTRCIDACPTQAIVSEGVVDATKCLSYISIEKRSELTSPEKELIQNHVFGCDICQDVCPWNRFAEPHNQERFEPQIVQQENWLEWDRDRWKNLNESEFKAHFGKSPVTRMGFDKLKSAMKND
jgi:epoxyqueuosine reductase